MKIFVTLVSIAAVGTSASPVDAKGFLSALLRGGARTAVRAGVHAGAQTYSGIKTYGPDTLTVEQLERCIGIAQELDKSSENVEKLANAVDLENAAIGRAQQLIANERELVDRYSDASVNAFNKKLAAMRDRIGTYNSSVDAANTVQTLHNSRVNSYNAECAKRYYAEDMDAAKAKLGLKVD